MFNVEELENAPEWDRHEPKDINRLISLIQEVNKDCRAENNKKLSKIIIKCDGEEIIINTELTFEEVAKLIYYHKEIGSSLIYIEDELYRKTIFLNPRAVSLIKDVTDDESIVPIENSEWCNKLAT